MRTRQHDHLSLHRARTRTLIQLGGLLEKVGLVDFFTLMIGADLQKDSDMKQPMAALTGALLELKYQLQAQDYSHDYLVIKGLQYLAQEQTTIDVEE